jgi:CubicO group peptidase (beta-lactamase class C family)
MAPPVRSPLSIAITVSALALAGCTVHASPPVTPTPPPISADDPRLAATYPAVSRYLEAEARKHDLPNLAFALVSTKGLVYFVGLGKRDASGAAVTPNTVFRIGSITKTFTGLALLKLRDEGKLNLDDPVAKYLPELGTARYPTSDSGPITLRHLVTHTSGLPRLGLLDYGDGHEVTRAELRAAAQNVTLDFAPGTRAVYSNLAMALAGPVIARAAGMPYREYMTREILGPLGLTHTVWDPESATPGLLAQGYQQKDQAFVPCGPLWRLGAAEAMGGLYSTIEDMSRYAAFHLSAWPPRDAPDPGPVKRSSVRESHLLAGFARSGAEGFGVNWVVKGERSLGHVVFHNGGTEGFHASLWMLPEKGLGVIALGPASGDLDGISHRALEMVVGSVAPEPRLGAPARAALGKVRALIDAADRDAVERAFSPGYLAKLPADEMVKFFAQVRSTAGSCQSGAVHIVAADSPESAEVELSCANRTVVVKLAVETAAPHRIVLLTINAR